MFVSLLLVILYFLPFFVSLGDTAQSIRISDWGVSLAAVTFTYSFVLYLWTPQKAIVSSALIVYLFLVATTATLVVDTGGTFSAFIALWIAVLAFAAVFGLWAGVPAILATAVYTYFLFLQSPETAIGPIVIATTATIGPLFASYILFHAKSRKSVKEETAYNRLATELNQVSNTSEVVIRAIDDGVIALDSKGNVELMNPSAQRILGWGSGDALKLNYPSVLKLSDEKNQPVTQANDPIAIALATNKDVHTKELYVTTGGKKRLLLSLVISPKGQLGEGVIVVFRDITKEAAEEREQAEFISTASHEMRTPVASIEGYLGLALNPNTAQIDDKARDFIEKAHGSAQHLGRLFQDLLDVSKADDGRLSNHPKVVDVIDYVGEIVEGLRIKAEEKQLRLFYKPQPDAGKDEPSDKSISPVFYTNVDNDHLREVVANLIENAIKYTPKGDVVVDVNGDDVHVKISVQDSGIGIAKEDAAHLFQKFYRIDNSATREIGGTGLGLYLCRRLAEVMGGRIWLDSQIDKGSTFYLELPRTDRIEAMRMLEAEESGIQAVSESRTNDPVPEMNDELAMEEPRTNTLSQPTPPTPIVQPTTQPQPQPVPANLEPVQEATRAPTLAEIEQNSSSYTTRPKANIQIPVRDHSQMNNP
jgi:PAS domain S-box-containing protein